MYLRETTGLKVRDLRDQVRQDSMEATQVSSAEIHLDFTGDAPTVGFPLGRQTAEVQATAESVSALAGWLDVPTKFLNRIDQDLAQHILRTMLERHPAPVTLYHDDGMLLDVRDPGQRVIPLSRLVEVASKAIDDEAEVVSAVIEPTQFALDVIAPEGFDRGIGGDPQVGDITRGGITIEQDRKRNLAPTVSPYLYRLFCTNGMVTRNELDKVDARGQGVDEVLTELELIAERAFGRVEQEIEAFYSLRDQEVDNPERTLYRMAQERGLPDRMTNRLLERIPAWIEGREDEAVSMFDLTNIITNQANEPSIRSRRNVARRLEEAGGTVVTDHVERCTRCQQAISH